jgi:hypothetical protein
MIFDAGKWIFRNLILSACDAARRFLAGRSPSGSPRIGWKPLILRWRKRAKDRTIGVTNRNTESTSNLSLPQFHFHFPLFNHGKRVSDGSHEFPATTRILKSTTLQNYFYSNGKAGTKVREKNNELRLSQTSDSNRLAASTHDKRTYPGFERARENGDSSRPSTLFHGRHVRTSETAQRFPRTRLGYNANRDGSTPDAPPAVSVQRVDALRFTPPTALQTRTKQSGFEASQIRRTSSLLTHFHLQESRVRSRFGAGDETSPSIRTRTRDDHSRQNARTIGSLSPHATGELIWRRTSETISDIVERVRELESLQTDGKSMARSASIRQEIVPSSSAAASTPSSITQLDPSLIDRLTDHVIRKVDQRVRIERERRGL